MELFLANTDDINTVIKIYSAVKGRGFCVWNDDYPTAAIAAEDQAAGCLYVLKNDGEIIGCASVEPIAEDDDLPFWRINDGSHREISRIAVLPAHQGKGYAKKMVSLLTDALKSKGIRSIHLLAAKENPPACKTYSALGFDLIGECFRYGHDYYVFEKLL
ncbi:MAG: GNAT family N-acetyltransferase [Clostridia bacterium]|nr:GNAT family N-acetyltransferase [Clostridia bacterium]